MSRGPPGRSGTYLGETDADDTDDRLYGMRVILTSVGESPSEAIRSACDCADYFSEVHIVLPGSHKRGQARAALKTLYGDSSEDKRDYSEDMKLLKESRIHLVLHTRYFNERLMSRHINRLIDVTGLTSFTADHLDEWLISRVDINYKRRGYKRMRYSMKAVVDEGNFSIWSPLIVALLIFNWWRSLFSSFNRTVEGVDLVMYPVHHDDEGPYIPEEHRFLGCIPTTGWPMDRDRRLAVSEGPRVMIPLHWTGFQRFMWLCRRQDMPGIMSLFGWTTLTWLLSIPYWNFLIPWLKVEWDATIRFTFFFLHTVAMVLLLPTVYKGEFQQLSILFATPVFIIALPFLVLYGALFYRGRVQSRRQRLADPEDASSNQKKKKKKQSRKNGRPRKGKGEADEASVDDDPGATGDSTDDDGSQDDGGDDSVGDSAEEMVGTLASEDLTTEE